MSTLIKYGTVGCNRYNHRTLTIEGSITVQLTTCLTRLDLTKQVKLYLHSRGKQLNTQNK